MITKTNNQLLKEVRNYKFGEKGFCTEKEIDELSEKLQLDEMNELQLRNLRDFTVASLNLEMWRDDYVKGDTRMNLISAITGVIDYKLFNLGKEV